MARSYKTSSFKKMHSGKMGGVGFYAPALPKDPHEKILVQIAKDWDFIRTYPNYPDMCKDARRRIKYRRLELAQLLASP